MAYTMYSDLIECEINDKVYVYNGWRSLKKIDCNMVGTVKSFRQSLKEEWDGMEYLSYSISITMRNGRIIKIRDDQNIPFLRKYEFITLEDLRKNHNINIEDYIK